MPDRMLARASRRQPPWQRWASGLRSVGGQQRNTAVAAGPVMASASSFCYIAASLLVFTTVGMAHQPRRVVLSEEAVAGAALVVGLSLAAARRRPPPWIHSVSGVLAVLLLTILLWLGRDYGSAGAYATLYVLISLFSFFFFTWPVGVRYECAIVLAIVGSHFGWGVLSTRSMVVLIGTNVVVAVVTGWLVSAAGAAEVDGITGVLNRRGFDRLLTEAVERAERVGTPLSVAILDLDHFKRVNERSGYRRGDTVLRATAALWRPMLPPGLDLARIGADEFAVLLPGHAAKSAADVIESLRSVLPDGQTCSGGLADWQPSDTESSLLNRVDTALYQAKQTGRDRTFVDARSNQTTKEMDEGLRRGEFSLIYQPIVTLTTGVLIAAEALVCWEHPTRGLVPAGEFIPMAEDSGFIFELGRWVLEAACREAASWPIGSVGPRLRLSVNVSGRELHQDDYVDCVAAILARTGFDPSRLVLEVTETVLDADAAQAMATLTGLRDLGVEIAMDDFGTGYSSLSRLDRLPVDILKIDESFVRAIGPRTENAPIIAAILALSQALGLRTVAKGVDEPYQARVLAGYGCDEAQGSLYGRPGPGHSLLADRKPRPTP